jgi:hypothetical protein
MFQTSAGNPVIAYGCCTGPMSGVQTGLASRQKTATP